MDAVEINTWYSSNRWLLWLAQCWRNSGHHFLLNRFLLFQPLLFQVPLNCRLRSYVCLQSNPKEQKLSINIIGWGVWAPLNYKISCSYEPHRNLKSYSSWTFLSVAIILSTKYALKLHHKLINPPSYCNDHSNGCLRHCSLASYLHSDNHWQNSM